ncbi:MAG TPA: isoprenylcysteine carboxylmethyltransferase family protein [Blastocatellia bacterium]|nr:isoprenylcysteine carboxylmethyltransferase family protein [Blastocatellia bacterium]
MKLLRHLLAILLLPGVVTIVIPQWIIRTPGATSPGWGWAMPLGLLPYALGTGLICCGLFLMVKTIKLFATVGQGTLAPWDPPRRFVARGIYRYVRNPMISGVFCILLGESALFGSWPLFRWFLLFFLITVIYIPLLEERDLERRFGDDYRLYKANVPRWIPRLTPWVAPGDKND